MLLRKKHGKTRSQPFRSCLQFHPRGLVELSIKRPVSHTLRSPDAEPNNWPQPPPNYTRYVRSNITQKLKRRRRTETTRKHIVVVVVSRQLGGHRRCCGPVEYSRPLPGPCASTSAPQQTAAAPTRQTMCLSLVSVDYEQMGPQLYLRSASYDSSRQFSVSVSRPTQRKTAPFGTCEVQSISRCYTEQLYETCPAASGTKDIGTADAGAPAACVRPASPRSRCAARPDPDT